MRNSITDIFDGIDRDIRGGLSRQQTIDRLLSEGVEQVNATDAYEAVLRRRRDRLRSRLMAAGALLMIGLVLFYFATL